MENSNLELPLCSLCTIRIVSLQRENYLKRVHISEKASEGENFGLNTYLSIDFKTDIHLLCRIKCAQYYRAGLGYRWFANTQFQITEGNKTAHDLIEKIKKMGYQELKSSGVYLYGTPGLGKSHLLASLCKAIIERNGSVRWENVSAVLTKLRSSFGRRYAVGEESIAEIISERLKESYLFLDDLGTESSSDWAKEVLYQAINYRYEEHLPLFVSSNLSLTELAEKMGDKFASRIVEMCKPIKIEGKDMRIKKAESEEKALNILTPGFSKQMASWDLETRGVYK